MAADTADGMFNHQDTEKGQVMDSFMSLVREMRAAQKEYFRTRSRESLQQSKALESRVDEEIRKAAAAQMPCDPNCIIMANGQKLIQGDLFA